MDSSKASSIEVLQGDIVIVGAGGAGAAAAVAAVEAGVKAKNIILLEERRRPGGNSALATCIFGAESPAQKRMGIDAQRDEFFRNHMDYSHWKIDPRVVRALIDISGDTIRWLEDMGAKFVQVNAMYPKQVATFHSTGPGHTGPKLMKALIKRCEDSGVQPRCGVSGKKLLTDAEGHVTGVLAKSKGNELRVMAKSVIIATGGCLGNKRLLKKYYPTYLDIDIAGIPFHGDGLLMAMEIGAALEGMVGTLEIYGPDFAPSTSLQALIVQPNTLWVNKRGERFTDEGIGSRSFGDCSNTIVRQPSKRCYTIFDQKIKRSNTEEGLAGGPYAWVYGMGKYRWEKDELPELEKIFQAQVKTGRVKISNSWDEIAKWMGADPKVLKATIDEYNAFCDQGYDEIFNKERRYLVPLRTPPYYAVEGHVHVYNTLGGLKVNHRMEVLDREDNPIRGLYATGMDTGGWESDTYNTGLLGHSIGFAIGSGRIAGENAAKCVLGK